MYYIKKQQSNKSHKNYTGKSELFANVLILRVLTHWLLIETPRPF